MKKILLIFFLLSLPTFASIPVKVLKIYDGDTIGVKIQSGNRFSIRLTGVDRYGRALGVVYFDDLNVNEELLKNKVCLPYEFVER